MSKRIITVSREYGSGGRAIAQKVAEALGYAFYDKELVHEIAKETGLAESFVIENGEYATSKNSILFNLALSAGIKFPNNLPMSDQLFIVQHNIIKDLAEKGSCVIVGRCADYILHERADCLHTFFHADMAFRADRVVSVCGEMVDAPEKALKEKDDKRKTYYKHYTGRRWGAAQNYHISLDSGVVGIDRCADIVVSLARNV
jgi:cytidylate kinase